MIFQHTWEKVLSGEKTQTRRIVKPNTGIVTNNGIIKEVIDGSVKKRTPTYAVGHTYAVTPARTKPALYWRWSDMTGTGYEVLQSAYSPELANWGWRQARIRITDIRREDVRNISWEDAIAEGFGSRHEFTLTWLAMHDKRAIPAYRDRDLPSGFTSAFAYIKTRPAEFYQAWALTFELVKE